MAGKSKPAISVTKPMTMISSTRPKPLALLVAIVPDLLWHSLRTNVPR
jgi:hypothetical protein